MHACSARPFGSAAAPGRRLVVRASTNGAGLAEGARVKVVKPLKVFHVPKHADGLQLEGMEGVVAKNVSDFKGSTLSANLPWRVQFTTEKDGAAVKFFAHLEEDELQAV